MTVTNLTAEPKPSRFFSTMIPSGRALTSPRGGSLLAALLVASVALASACGARQSPEVEVVDEPGGDGTLVVSNRSSLPITRIWLSPAAASSLEIGASPDELSTLAPGQTWVTGVPGGWWTIWLEADTGEDALIEQSWFNAERPVVLEVTDAWWSSGDWISGPEPTVAPAAPERSPEE